MQIESADSMLNIFAACQTERQRKKQNSLSCNSLQLYTYPVCISIYTGGEFFLPIFGNMLSYIYQLITSSEKGAVP